MLKADAKNDQVHICIYIYNLVFPNFSKSGSQILTKFGGSQEDPSTDHCAKKQPNQSRECFVIRGQKNFFGGPYPQTGSEFGGNGRGVS